jgi:hypothetical protein
MELTLNMYFYVVYVEITGCELATLVVVELRSVASESHCS